MARRVPPRHQNKPKVRIKVKIKKDDTVKVIAGRDRGKTGRVLQVDAEKGKVLVEGVSMLKRHTRPNPQKQIKGGIAERESAIAISNVMVMTSGGVATRVGYRVEGNRSVRVAKKGGESLDKK
ncbi:MAG TPA: 50S ribosomal protein L24 [Bryobacteraceae bacterium]|nr:50S ribosomal protein L24 [Bryobacteraceae bacterium]